MNHTQAILQHREFLEKFAVDPETWTILGRKRHFDNGRYIRLTIDDLEYLCALTLTRCLEFKPDSLEIESFVVTFARGEISGQRVSIRYIRGTLHLSQIGEVINELSELIRQRVWKSCRECTFEKECENCLRQSKLAVSITAIERGPEVVYPPPLTYLPNRYRILFTNPQLYTPLRPQW